MEYVSDWHVTCGFRFLDRDMLRFYSAHKEVGYCNSEADCGCA